jgi:hypothetical protein
MKKRLKKLAKSIIIIGKSNFVPNQGGNYNEITFDG